MAKKRFRKGYVLGDTGLIDEEGELKWFIENINSVSDLEKNWNKVIDKLNELNEEKEDWKNNCLKSASENSILWNEISILWEKGAEPTDAFKNYCKEIWK